jgi:hypothetical protein
MSFEITTAFVKQYSGNVQLLSQQKGSRLRAHVRYEDQTGEHAFHDQIGATEARKRTSRHGDTPLVGTPHSRRRVTLADYDWADLIDKFDKVKTLIDPTSPYAINAAYAMGRAMDTELIAAAVGTAYTGVDGSTGVALPSAQKVAHGSAGLTVAKLLSAKEILDGSEVDEEEERIIAVSSKQVTNLLNTTEVKSSDYNTVKALAKGEIDSFLGFTFKRTQRLGTDGDGNRQVTAWAKTGLLLAVGVDIVIDIGPRRDKNNATQVYVGMSIGATRMEEEKVVEIACVES